MPFKYDVFLSHSSVDKVRVSQLAEKLRNAKLTVWLDDTNILVGGNIPDSVNEGLEQSCRIVLCISANSVASDWVKLELSQILMKDPLNKKGRFLPLLLTKCQLPDAIGSFKYIDYQDESESALQKLIDACCAKTVDAPQSTLQTFDTLRKLAENYPSILASIEQSRQDLQGIADHIRRLNDLKTLHDHLHDLQVSFYNQIQAAEQVPPDFARKMLKTSSSHMNTLVHLIKELQAKEILSREAFEWVEDLEKAKERFDAFLKEIGPSETLDEVKIPLESILQVQPAKINQIMVHIADDLNLHKLVEVMRAIHRKLRESALNPATLQDIGKSVDNLADLEAKLIRLIQKHNQWQNLHNFLYRLDPATAKPKQVAIQWKQIWRSAEAILGSSQEEWTMKLREEGALVAQALAREEPSALFDHLKLFQSEAEERFYAIDGTLLDHCKNLNDIGVSLAMLLQVQ